MRRAAKIDTNHRMVVEAFEAHGCTVLSLAFTDRVAALTGRIGASRIFVGDAPAEVAPLVRHLPR